MNNNYVFFFIFVYSFISEIICKTFSLRVFKDKLHIISALSRFSCWYQPQWFSLDNHEVEIPQLLSQILYPNTKHILTYPLKWKYLIRLEVNKGVTVLVAANKDVRDSVYPQLYLSKEKSCM